MKRNIDLVRYITRYKGKILVVSAFLSLILWGVISAFPRHLPSELETGENKKLPEKNQMFVPIEQSIFKDLLFTMLKENSNNTDWVVYDCDRTLCTIKSADNDPVRFSTGILGSLGMEKETIWNYLNTLDSDCSYDDKAGHITLSVSLYPDVNGEDKYFVNVPAGLLRKVLNEK